MRRRPMTRYGSADVGFLLVGGRDILGDSTMIEDSQEAITEDVTALGDDDEGHAYVGVDRYMVSQQGFYNDATDRSNAALVGIGTSKVMAFAPEGNTVGKRLVATASIIASYVRQLSRGALHKANASYVSAEKHDEGVILHALGARTAAGNSEGAASVDNGASSAAGGAGHLQVTALTLDGYTNVVVKVRHSADDVTYADLLTFTAVTAAPAAERKTVAGTVNRHLASAWAFTGAGTAPSVTFMAGFARH
jgi:hypothetical protein